MRKLNMFMSDGVMIIGRDPFVGKPGQWMPKEVYTEYIANRPRVTTDLVLIDSKGCVLLGLRTLRPVQDWSCMGGFRKVRESNAVAAARVAREEADLVLDPRKHHFDEVGRYEYVIGDMDPEDPDGDSVRHDVNTVMCCVVTDEEAARVQLNKGHFSDQRWVPLIEVTFANGYPLITTQWADDLRKRLYNA
ncbi:MAG TPA: NUDIX domain-containing protein [Candidatus Saccharimonadales bacterium]|nr:NUDIX domain-containing protein [Candidatus Saccharimonadales bacterium]